MSKINNLQRGRYPVGADEFGFVPLDVSTSSEDTGLGDVLVLPFDAGSILGSFGFVATGSRHE